jgi:hypothetical protein
MAWTTGTLDPPLNPTDASASGTLRLALYEAATPSPSSPRKSPCPTVRPFMTSSMPSNTQAQSPHWPPAKVPSPRRLTDELLTNITANVDSPAPPLRVFPQIPMRRRYVGFWFDRNKSNRLSSHCHQRYRWFSGRNSKSHTQLLCVWT